MNEVADATHAGRPIPLPVLAVLFFASGAAGLIYETLWSKHLQLIFGSTTEAVSVVLATFMTGLGIGSYLFAARADRMKHPVKLYAYLEIGIGIFAILTTPLLALATIVYSEIAGAAQLEGTASIALKLIVSVLVLLPPAILMGGTFPAIVRAPSGTSSRRRIAALYAVNILGAVAGTLATGFFFIQSLGLSLTMLLTAAMNIVIGLIALLLVRLFDRAAVFTVDAGATTRRILGEVFSSSEGRVVAAGLFISGASTMLYEVIFTRILVIIIGVSTHAFTIVLAAFLTGLGLGALFLSIFLKRRTPHLVHFAVTQISIAIFAAAVMASLPLFPRFLLYLHQIPGLGYWDIFGTKSLLLFLLLVPLSVVAGVSTPLLIAALAREEERLSRTVGAAYVINTAGTIAGSLAAGFVVIPFAGSENGLKFTIALNLGVAILATLLVASRQSKLAIAGLASIAFAIALGIHWPVDLYLRSDSRWSNNVIGSRLQIEQELASRATGLLFFAEGRNATVAVTSTGGARTLLVNGHPDASDRLDMSTQAFLGAVPLVVKHDAKEVMVIGFGAGVSADRVARYEGVQRVDVVEIERAVVEASPAFHHVNHAVEKNAKVRIIYDDARTVLQTRETLYDLIISEPSNPWRAGIASLFTKDFYELSGSRLRPGGVFAQWVQLYGLEPDSVRMILATFNEAFEHSQVWFLDGGDIVILGSDRPMSVDLTTLRTSIYPTFANDFRRYGEIRSADEVLGLYVGSNQSLASFTAGAPIHTDDLPLLEAAAEEGLYEARIDRNGALLLAEKLRSGAVHPPLSNGSTLPSASAAWLQISKLYRAVRDPDAAGIALGRSIQLAGDLSDRAHTALERARTRDECDPLREFLQFREARVHLATCQLRRGEVDNAIDSLQRIGRLQPVEMLRFLEHFVRLRQPKLALAIARELIPQIRLGSEVSAIQGVEILNDVVTLADQGIPPAQLLPLVDRVPAWVGTAPILRARALLTFATGDLATALPMLEKLRELGWLEERTLRAELEAARKVLPAARAAERSERIRELAPEVVQIEVVSPLLDRRD